MKTININNLKKMKQAIRKGGYGKSEEVNIYSNKRFFKKERKN